MKIKTVILNGRVKNFRQVKNRAAIYRSLRLLSLFFIFSAVGCSSSLPEKKRSPLLLDIRVDKDVNPNRYGEAAPVNIAIYRMSLPGIIDSEITELRDFGENNGAKRIFSAVFQPGESRCLTLPLMADTRAIGVTGEFRDIDHAQWKSVQPLPQRDALPWWKKLFTSRDNTLYARVHRLGLTLTETE